MTTWQADFMSARRLTTTIALGGLGIGLLSGCVPRDGRTFPNATDVTRAQQVWGDPWLAPGDTQTVEPKAGSDVRRDVARRGYLTAASTRSAVATEVRAALASGWNLVGVECEPDTQESAGTITAELTRGSTVDDGRYVVVQAFPPLPEAAAGRPTQVGLAAYVAHHLDTSWPASERQAIGLEGSCLLSTALPPLPSPSPTQPSESPSASPSWARPDLPGEQVPEPEWPGDPFPDDLRDAMENLRDDTALGALGVTLQDVGDPEDSGPHISVQSPEKPITAPTDLTQTVASLTSQGWTLTYAGCIGPGAPNLAELSRPAGKRTAVLRLSQVPATAGASPVEAKVVVSTPGYSPAAPAAISEPCFAEAAPQTTFSHRGVPSLGPTRMLPLQR
ncbi:hypothetical protein JNB_00475 [Janibacter sp. HTCC2649]|nr:hypothetical protein JNB_00475 [Janibacter sp. HTCC2649]